MKNKAALLVISAIAASALSACIPAADPGKVSSNSDMPEAAACNSKAVQSYIGNRFTAVLAEQLRKFMVESGERKAAAMLGISVSRLKGFVSGAETRNIDRLARAIAAKLPAALTLRSKLSHDRQAELHSLNEEVDREGLRAVARRLGIDPSNLRRKLAKVR